MANHRTVDPTAEYASNRVIGIRIIDRQVEQLDEMAKNRGISRSQLIRQLIQDAWTADQQPEPF
jgi:metal-responsive CopG/Arc/MetJ family transcriptional regulator